LNRSLAGSESKDEDMAAYLQAAAALQEAFDCLVVIVHHCGTDDSRPRGHTSQTGAADVQISVRKDAERNVVVTVDFAKDMPEGTTLELGRDQDGDPITTCVVVPVEDGAFTKPGKPKAKKPMRPACAIALRALKEAIAELGEVTPASNHIPANTRGVTKEQWRDYANRLGICPTSGQEATTPEEADKFLKQAQRKAFWRASTELIRDDLVGWWNDFVWLPARKQPPHPNETN
jgi:hypothetical protein